MYNKINVFFQELVMLDDANHVMLLNLWGELLLVLERGKELVLQYGSAKWFELAVKGENQEAFNKIHLSLCTYIKTFQKEIHKVQLTYTYPIRFITQQQKQ